MQSSSSQNRIPKVSICVPNLNTRPFLPERFETIFKQSFQDWELLVYDSYSTDGAWEYITGLAAREPRMRIWQGPKEGTPGSWNPCIRQARGEYVYVATSDDTMAPDCLEKMVGELEAHPECDLAHCTLRAIDEKGADVADWWSGYSAFALSSGELLRRRHIRRGPFDGMLHLLGETVYTSITQLLIRRSLFDRTGPFESRWGSVGDFNWSMRAGLVASTVHVPDTWGGWRVHSSQATAGARLGSIEHADKIEGMIEDAIATCEKYLASPVRERLVSRWAGQTRELRAFRRELTRQRSSMGRKAFTLGRLLSGSWAARTFLMSKYMAKKPWSQAAPDLLRAWLEDAGVGQVLVPLQGGASSPSSAGQNARIHV